MKGGLEVNDSLSVEDMMNVQMNQHNLYASEFSPDLLTSIKGQDSDCKYADVITLLEDWNMVDAKESGAPLVFHMIMEQLQEVLFKDAMPEDMYWAMKGKYQITDRLLRKVLGLRNKVVGRFLSTNIQSHARECIFSFSSVL